LRAAAERAQLATKATDILQDNVPLPSKPKVFNIRDQPKWNSVKYPGL
jgi:hypothetical protein